MVLQKQNKNTRYTNSFNIFAIGILVLVFVIRFGILIQKSQSDLLSLSNQIQGKNAQYTPESNIKVIGSTKNKNSVLTGSKINTGDIYTGNKQN